MVITKKELAEKLASLRRILAGGSNSPAANSIFLDHDQAKTYNANSWEACIVKLSVDLGFTALVPATKLLTLVDSLGEGDIELSLDDEGNNIIVKSGRVSGKFAVLPEDYWPTFQAIKPPENWTAVPADLREGLALCRQGTTGKGRIALAGVHISGNVVESSTGYQITRYEAEQTLLETSVIMPTGPINNMIKHSGDLVEWSVLSGLIQFRMSDGTVFLGQEIAAEYPHTEDWVEKAHGLSDEISFPAEVADACARHGNLQDGLQLQDREAAFEFDSGKLRITSKDDQYVLDETLDIPEFKRDMKFKINPAFLHDVLQKTTTMKYSPTENYIMFTVGKLMILSMLSK